MTSTDQATAARCQFVHSVLGSNKVSPNKVSIESASSDASTRSYWRVRVDAGSASSILMDASAAAQGIESWLDVQQRLRAANVHVPEVLGSDSQAGFVLMSDLGDQTYLDRLDTNCVDAMYEDALDVLQRMQNTADATNLPLYDAPRLRQEFELMQPWFLERHLGASLDDDQRGILNTAAEALIAEAIAQPQCFVHRDFHSRNLMFLASDNPGVLDFQDAVYGPISYDLASLLRDCYISWEDARVYAWVDAYAEHLRRNGALDAGIGTGQFRRWFDWIGLQRHIKVLGIFCRLHYRDGKSGYLAELPRVLAYVIATCKRYPEFTSLAVFLASAVAGRELAQPRAP